MLTSMQNKGLLALSLVGFLIATAGCSMDTVGSADVHAASIYQSYDLGYSGDTNNTTLLATFRVGGGTGTTVQLSSPSQLLVNGVKAQPVAFLGTNYQAVVGGFVPNVQLSYTDQNDHTYENNLTIQPVTFASQVPSDVNLNGGLELSLVVPNYSPGDWIEGNISEDGTQNDGGVSASSDNYDSQTGVLEFDSKELSGLQPGPAVLTVTRTVWESLGSVTPTGGSAAVTYTTASVPLTLILNSATLAQNIQRNPNR